MVSYTVGSCGSPTSRAPTSKKAGGSVGADGPLRVGNTEDGGRGLVVADIEDGGGLTGRANYC